MEARLKEGELLSNGDRQLQTRNFWIWVVITFATAGIGYPIYLLITARDLKLAYIKEMQFFQTEDVEDQISKAMRLKWIMLSFLTIVGIPVSYTLLQIYRHHYAREYILTILKAGKKNQDETRVTLPSIFFVAMVSLGNILFANPLTLILVLLQAPLFLIPIALLVIAEIFVDWRWKEAVYSMR